MTETINEKKKYWKGITLIKGNCEVCNGLKVEKHAKRYGETNF